MEFKTAKAYRDFLFSTLPPPTDIDDLRNITVSIDRLVEKKFPEPPVLTIISPHSLVKNKNKTNNNNNNKRSELKKPKITPLTEIQEQFVSRRRTRPARLDSISTRDASIVTVEEMLTEMTAPTPKLTPIIEDDEIIQLNYPELLNQLSNQIPEITDKDINTTPVTDRDSFQDMAEFNLLEYVLDQNIDENILEEAKNELLASLEIPDPSFPTDILSEAIALADLSLTDFENGSFQSQFFDVNMLGEILKDVNTSSDVFADIEIEPFDSTSDVNTVNTNLKDQKNLALEINDKLARREDTCLPRDQKNLKNQKNLYLSMPSLSPYYEDPVDPPSEMPVLERVDVNKINYELLLKDLELSDSDSDLEDESVNKAGVGVGQKNIKMNKPVLDLAMKKCLMFDLSISGSEDEDIDDAVKINRKPLDLALKKIIFEKAVSEEEDSEDSEPEEKIEDAEAEPERKSEDAEPEKKIEEIVSTDDEDIFVKPKDLKKKSPPKKKKNTDELKLGEIFPFSYLYFRMKRFDQRKKTVKVPAFLPRLGTIFPFHESLYTTAKIKLPALGIIFPFTDEFFEDDSEEEDLEDDSEESSVDDTTNNDTDNSEDDDDDDNQPNLIPIEILDREDLELILNAIPEEDIPAVLEAIKIYHTGTIRLLLELKAPHPRIKIIFDENLGVLFPFSDEIYCDDKIYVGGGKLQQDSNDPNKKKIIKKVYNTRSKNKNKNTEPEKIEEIFPFDDEVIENSRDRVILKYIQIREIGKRFIRKFNNHIIDYKINFKKKLPPSTTGDLITKALDEMITYTKKETNWQQGDRMSILAENPKFYYPISTGYTCDNLTKKLKDKLMQIITSNDQVVLTDCTFTVHVVNMPRGAKPRKIINLNKDKHTKRSILPINNNDNLCAPRAIITGLTYHTNKILGRTLDNNDIIYIRKGRALQTELARKLCDGIGEYCLEGFTLDDIRSCEELLKVQIKIICAENFNNIIYKGKKDCKSKIYLYKQGNHFDLINRLGAFYGSSYYCVKCDKPYQNKNQHVCKVPKKDVCNMCMKAAHEKATKDKTYCHNCNRYAYNQECMKDHGVSVCAASFRCRKCSKILKRADFSKHQCGYAKCRNCQEIVEKETHRCYMLNKAMKGRICGCRNCTPGSTKVNDKCTYTEKYIFFDYEAQQETGTHKPNLVVAKYFNGDTFTFNTNEEFCSWLIDRKHQGYTAIAHYAKGYDSHFILQYLVANTMKPNTIYSGSKLMFLEVGALGFKVLDSHNFVAAPLSAFPKTFELTELKKGYFPHYFNTKENENYVGPIPDKKHYGYDTMKEDARKKFIEWHDKKVEEGYVFDLAKELREYCDSDVDILRKGCLDFRKQFLEVANIDPFQYVTIASVCMAVYRHSHLKEKTIAVVENFLKDNYSKQSILWLESFNNPNIKHALNGGEVELCGARVDGFDHDNKTVYQYHGCLWHGCPKCYDGEFINPMNKTSCDDLLQKTKDRTKRLERAGYTVIEEWECKWVKTKRYKEMAKEREIIEPLNPRDALFGGRTEVFKLKYSTKNVKKSLKKRKNRGEVTHSDTEDELDTDLENTTEEELLVKYADVVSLYPSVMYYDYYPIGHPTKIIKPGRHDTSWYGLIKCKILPPKNLYIPVLPVRVKMYKAEKLVFPLCEKCAENQQPLCNHTDEERQITGTWSTIEVNKALEMGYKVTDVYEVWDFDKSNSLWKGYVTAFMKLKLETSPHNYPSNEAYARDIEEKMGIKLDIDKIASNPGKRAVAKLCLNSLWGKFGQRQNMSQTEFVSDPYRFYEILLDDRLQDVNVIYVTDEMVQVNYRYKEAFVENTFSTNIFVAIYTTANARLRLYKQLERLDRYVMYCDTDSIVYLDNGQNTIPHGEMLGEWTDELNGGHIDRWLATGPKSYHYVTNTGKTTTKVKGFTLHHKNALKINGEAMEKLIDGEIQNVVISDRQITRDQDSKQLVNKEQKKTFSFGFDKRLITDNFDTKPYGYVA